MMAGIFCCFLINLKRKVFERRNKKRELDFFDIKKQMMIFVERKGIKRCFTVLQCFYYFIFYYKNNNTQNK